MPTERLIGSLVIDGESIDLIETAYADGRLAVVARETSGLPWGKLSVNPGPEIAVPAGTFAVKTWSENGSWWRIAEASGLFIPTGTVISIGDLAAPLWRIRPA